MVMRKISKISICRDFRCSKFTIFCSIVMLIFLSQFTYFDYIESLPRVSCSLPTITWFRQPEDRIPENFKENRKWDLKILKAPNCPETATFIRLIKTAQKL